LPFDIAPKLNQYMSNTTSSIARPERRNLGRFLLISSAVVLVAAIGYAGLIWLVGLTAESAADVAGTTRSFVIAAILAAVGIVLGIAGMALRQRK
jgi:hypothetical protein